MKHNREQVLLLTPSSLDNEWIFLLCYYILGHDMLQTCWSTGACSLHFNSTKAVLKCKQLIQNSQQIILDDSTRSTRMNETYRTLDIMSGFS